MLDWDKEFEWDEHNESHIARHQVDRYEAEDAARDPGAVVRRASKDRYGNPRYLYIARTQEGRILVMVIDRKRQDLWRIGMARDATFKEKRSYRGRNR